MKYSNRIYLIGGILLAALSLMSCGRQVRIITTTSEKVTVKRAISPFDKIEISGSPNVVYEQGDSCTVTVKGPKELVDDIVTEMNGNTLIVRNKGKIGVFNIELSDDEGLVVYVTSPDLIGVQLSGSGEFVCKNRIDTDYINVTLRGPGDIDIHDLICDHCITELTGSGDLDIDRLEAKISEVTLIGSGDIDLKQYNVEQTDIILKGSGDIAIDFNDGCVRSDAKLQGSGDIKLKGKLKKFNGTKTGSGSIDTGKLIVP